MADITMCKDSGCERRRSCYRFNAPVNEHRQAYFAGTVRKADGSCEYYLQQKSERHLRVVP